MKQNIQIVSLLSFQVDMHCYFNVVFSFFFGGKECFAFFTTQLILHSSLTLSVFSPCFSTPFSTPLFLTLSMFLLHNKLYKKAKTSSTLSHKYISSFPLSWNWASPFSPTVGSATKSCFISSGSSHNRPPPPPSPIFPHPLECSQHIWSCICHLRCNRLSPCLSSAQSEHYKSDSWPDLNKDIRLSEASAWDPNPAGNTQNPSNIQNEFFFFFL